ncbi:MAG: plasmid pRiA4b ORF-3 family protein [Cyanobacteria bacterium P01_F01_bin.143]
MPSKTTIYQLKITLRNIKPPLWRRVQVESSITLLQLHLIIQAAMGWYNCHLHSFTIGGIEYGKPEPNYGLGFKDENKAKLASLIKKEKAKFLYTYDFGDSWEHLILVEKILPKEPKVSYPICIKAKRACPPEDCGGPWGYMEFLEAIQDPNHPEHESFLEWLGGDFDSEFYDLNEINQRLLGFERFARQRF